MKSKRIIQRDKTAALYVRLMVENHDELANNGTAGCIRFYGGGPEWTVDSFAAHKYRSFLCSQATYTPSSQGYCYYLAVREITGNGQ